MPEPEGPNPNDEQLQERLENLKKKDESAITDLNLKQRLAQLHDQEYVEEKPNRDIFQVDTKSDQEKINDLVERYSNEAALDVASDPVKDLEDRLNRLRGPVASFTSAGPGTNKTVVSSASGNDGGDSDDDDKRYVKKVEIPLIL